MIKAKLLFNLRRLQLPVKIIEIIDSNNPNGLVHFAQFLNIEQK
jgi:hypothetical protein